MYFILLWMNYPTLNDRHFSKKLLIPKNENIIFKWKLMYFKFLSGLYSFIAERPYVNYVNHWK